MATALSASNHIAPLALATALLLSANGSNAAQACKVGEDCTPVNATPATASTAAPQEQPRVQRRAVLPLELQKELDSALSDPSMTEQDREAIQAAIADYATRAADSTQPTTPSATANATPVFQRTADGSKGQGKGESQEPAASQAATAASGGGSVETATRQSVFQRAAEEASEAEQATLSALLGLHLDESDGTTPQQLKGTLDKVTKALDASQPIKIDYLVAVEGANGNMVFISETGRYVFKGTMYDMLNGMKAMKSVKDVREYALRTNYQKLRLDPETLSSAKIGTGSRWITVYVDPTSPVTRQVIEQALDFPEIKDYSFYFVVLPSDTIESQQLARKFYCAREKGDKTVGDLLFQGRLNTLSDTACSDINWRRTISAAYFTGVDGLPFFVRDDGTISRGVPSQGLYNWLTELTVAQLSTPLRTGRRPTREALEVERRAIRAATYQQASKEQQEEAMKNYRLPQPEAGPGRDKEGKGGSK